MMKEHVVLDQFSSPGHGRSSGPPSLPFKLLKSESILADSSVLVKPPRLGQPALRQHRVSWERLYRAGTCRPGRGWDSWPLTGL